MSELKVYHCNEWHNECTKFYRKSEADKVIAELEDKLKEQTSIAEEEWKESGTYHTSYAEAVKALYDKNKEIVELKKACNDKDDWCLHTLKENRHHKYKRCLNNAWWCRKSSNAYAWNASNHRGWKIAGYYDKKAELYRKWHERWFELAEKFKEAK